MVPAERLDAGVGPPVCPVCSKPIRAVALAVVEGRERFHTICRSRLTQLQALELVDRAGRGLRRAEELTTQAHELRREAWLIIVGRDHGQICRELQRCLEGRAEIVVDRRGLTVPWAGPERRRPLALHEATTWRDFGFQLVYREAA